MRIARGVIAGAAMLFSTIAFPQQGLPGTYIAYYADPALDGVGRPQQQSATLEIESVQDRKVNGSLFIGRFFCRGKYDIQGTYQDNKLEMRVGAGALKDCGEVQLLLEVRGEKLVGKLGQTDVEFSRK